MTVQELIDKMREVKEILEDVALDDGDFENEWLLGQAYQIIDNMLIDYRVENAPALKDDNAYLAEYNQVREQAGLEPLGK